MTRITTIRNLREFFMNSVSDAMDRQGVAADAHTAHYVVNLLTLFARSEELFDETEEGRALTPIASVLAAAADANDVAERRHALQRAGDVSLFVAGFFGDGLASRLVGVDYYVRMGGAAYQMLAMNLQGSARGDAVGPVFAELAQKFQHFVDVLADVREGPDTSDQDVLRLYDNWQRTGSDRAARLLRGIGIEPTRVSPQTAH